MLYFKFSKNSYLRKSHFGLFLSRNIKFMLHNKSRQNIDFYTTSYFNYNTFFDISQPFFDNFSKKDWIFYEFFQCFKKIYCRFGMIIVIFCRILANLLCLLNKIALHYKTYFSLGKSRFNELFKIQI